MVTIEKRLLQFHLEHHSGRTARVIAMTLDDACRACEWYNADVRVMGLQPVDAFVVEREDPRASSRTV